jgi:hypothetical protein
MYCIYKILNSVNNKSYIGSTSVGKSRWNSHLYNLRNNKHPNIHLQNSWNKYGETAFTFIVLESFDFSKLSNEEVVNILLEKEQFYVETYKPEYNIRIITRSNLGLKFSEESKQKISESVKSRDKKVWEKSAEANKKPIIAYDQNGQFIEEFLSSKDAALRLNVAATNITSVLKGKGNFIKNLHFRYKTDNYPLTIDMTFVKNKRSVAALSNRVKSRKPVGIYKDGVLIKKCISIKQAMLELNTTKNIYQIVNKNKTLNGYTVKTLELIK